MLQLSANGDRAAFEQFAARHRAAVFRFAKAISSSDSDAEEVLQGAFIDAWRGAATFRATGGARSWLFTIARHVGRRLHRRRSGEPTTYDDLSVLGCDAGWGVDDAPLSRTIEQREWVSRSLERLPIADRELLLLVDVEGNTVAEAAAALELTVAATKSRLHRARLRLVAALRLEGGNGR